MQEHISAESWTSLHPLKCTSYFFTPPNYLLTGDEALIEKLSPEVRGIVEEVVAKLRQASGQKDKRKSGAGKKSEAKKKPGAGGSKSGSRGRTRKQLR